MDEETTKVMHSYYPPSIDHDLHAAPVKANVQLYYTPDSIDWEDAYKCRFMCLYLKAFIYHSPSDPKNGHYSFELIDRTGRIAIVCILLYTNKIEHNMK